MLFKRSVLEDIARGEVTLAFRRWKKPMVSPGTRLRTALGELLIGAVSPSVEAELDEEQARQAGFSSLAELRNDLRDGDGRQLYRIELRGLETDRRIALRNDTALSAQDTAALAAKLQRWDKASGRDGYHRQILEAIAAGPGSAAASLAEQLGVEKPKLKRDVRKLKELGLTESLEVGYRLSPRGAHFLDFSGEVS
ncbi:ASCH domain-containing protein [Chelativorans salis]|uniref:ASCH domain-containing protein n=1 Tax=Chelativorans salis TaxID=2978478 RepID=A0ABT2LH90_9HYPH|nr:ASCH domain-containing protein [Chelativorans sp. EGI FJ00035]MCT7373911.1 ASCH domain-containing protein [Chelativorans sp. EGI FJ00035]